MILTCLLLALGWPPMQSPPVQQTGKSLDVEAAKSDPGIGAKLLHVQRIYVETFGDDTNSKHLQDMIANALAASKKFIVTENKDKADAVLKGSTGQFVHQETRS